MYKLPFHLKLKNMKCFLLQKYPNLLVDAMFYFQGVPIQQNPVPQLLKSADPSRMYLLGDPRYSSFHSSNTVFQCKLENSNYETGVNLCLVYVLREDTHKKVFFFVVGPLRV